MLEAIYYSTNYPHLMNGKLTYKVKIKTDYMRTDGTCALYIQCFLNKQKKIIPLDISADPKFFDKTKQRLKTTFKFYKDYNLIIENKLSKINDIEVNYRLSNNSLSMEELMENLNNPTARLNFIKFWEDEMIRQKDILKPGTYRQQISILGKVKKYKNPLFFNEINDDFIQDLKTYCSCELLSKLYFSL